jgi:hypothetical protein
MQAAFREGTAGLGFSPAFFLLALTGAGCRRLLACLLGDASRSRVAAPLSAASSASPVRMRVSAPYLPLSSRFGCG